MPAYLEEPAYFVAMQQPEDNRFRPEVAELGRKLFYDPILSSDHTVSCATCHQPERAFTDGRPVSVGLQGAVGERNAISLGNVGYRYKGLFWDGKAESLEASVSHPLTSAHEMGSDWPTVLGKLNKNPDYSRDFAQVFGKREGAIKREEVEKALAQFMRSLITSGSKFDQVLSGKVAFDASEERGFHLFFDSAETLPDAECGHCHTDPLFTSLEFANNGIEAVVQLEEFRDVGRAGVSGQYWDKGKFRIPSLRNVALTAPYMHDGRFQTLEEVIEHYASGGHAQLNTSPNVRKLQLNDQHKADLVAFLHTLTDSNFIQEERFSNPFK